MALDLLTLTVLAQHQPMAAIAIGVVDRDVRYCAWCMHEVCTLSFVSASAMLRTADICGEPMQPSVCDRCHRELEVRRAP